MGEALRERELEKRKRERAHTAGCMVRMNTNSDTQLLRGEAMYQSVDGDHVYMKYTLDPPGYLCLHIWWPGKYILVVLLISRYGMWLSGHKRRHSVRIAQGEKDVWSTMVIVLSVALVCKYMAMNIYILVCLGGYGTDWVVDVSERKSKKSTHGGIHLLRFSSPNGHYYHCWILLYLLYYTMNYSARCPLHPTLCPLPLPDWANTQREREQEREWGWGRGDVLDTNKAKIERKKPLNLYAIRFVHYPTSHIHIDIDIDTQQQPRELSSCSLSFFRFSLSIHPSIIIPSWIDCICV